MPTYPARTRHVRVSVRTKAETADVTWLTPTKVWTHARYQRGALTPISARERAELAHSHREADWRFVTRLKPAIAAGSRLVLEDADENDLLTLDVLNVTPAANRRMVCWCREIGEVQS